ncbi:hypothetical protein FB451DRAFT_464359 [Mycena latifolia]|nr:hypothetical protein FB451DRAFT_464359 [Mycena latifolia]
MVLSTRSVSSLKQCQHTHRFWVADSTRRRTMVEVLRDVRSGVMIPEIWDHILGMLHGRAQDLRSCALICRALTFIAQSHLFYTISLARAEKGINADIAAACWLSFYLRRSPHLVPLIHRLFVYFHPRILEQLSRVGRLPRLQNIQFFPPERPVSNTHIPRSWIEYAHDITALSSVTQVAFNFMIFQDINDLESLVQGLGPNVKTLCIRFTRIKYPFIPFPLFAPPTVRPQITNLVVIGSPSIAGWLNSPHCSLNLNHLIKLDITSSARADFSAVLRSSRSTIQDLRFGKGNLDEGLDLAMFPALVALQAAPISTHGLLTLTRALENISPLNYIQKFDIVLQGFEGMLWPEEVEGHLTSFDAALNGLPLPALQSVTVRLCGTAPFAERPENVGVRSLALFPMLRSIHGPRSETEDQWWPGPTAATKRELVAELLPALDARGVLLVTAC